MSALAGGGLRAVGMKVDAGALKIAVTGAPEQTLPIGLGPDELPDAKAITIETIAIGGGRSVVHVRAPSKTRRGVAWEAIVAGRESPVLYAATTGYVRGEEGEREGEALEIRDRGDGSSFVLAGDVKEQLRICGQDETLLSPRALDAKTLEFRGATVQRLTAEAREGAKQVVASVHGGPADPPLAKLFAASGASTAIGNPSAVTDGDAATTWSEARPGDGHGEFVVMRAPAEVPIPRASITLAPPSTASLANGAAPKTFFLVTSTETIAVTLPEDAWLHPGNAYDVAFAEPLRASCVALVLDAAYVRAGNAHPDVTVAELTAYSEFDSPSAKIDDVVKALAGGGARAQAAAALLKRAGSAGLAATAAKFDSLDAGGRALAIDVAASAGSCDAAPLLAKALGDSDREVARKSREKIERCGKVAAPALVDAVKSGSEKARIEAATLLASIAPSVALDALSGAAGQGAPETRAAIRRGLAKAARGAPSDRIAAIVSDASGGAEAKLDRLRALESDLAKVAGPADAAIDEVSRTAPSMRTRYLVVGPIASLARAGDAKALAKLVATLATDEDPAIRAHAAESAASIDGARAALVRALADPAPRVREAAARSLEHAVAAESIDALASAAARDPWTFVRAAAVSTLASAPPSPAADDAIARAMDDDAASVRTSAIAALASRNARAFTPRIRAHLTDEHEATSARAAAARALGDLCDRESTGLLTARAKAGTLPMANEVDVQIGAAATAALRALASAPACR